MLCLRGLDNHEVPSLLGRAQVVRIRLRPVSLHVAARVRCCGQADSALYPGPLTSRLVRKMRTAIPDKVRASCQSS